jgi:hypothetical protein
MACVPCCLASIFMRCLRPCVGLRSTLHAEHGPPHRAWRGEQEGSGAVRLRNGGNQPRIGLFKLTRDAIMAYGRTAAAEREGRRAIGKRTTDSVRCTRAGVLHSLLMRALHPCRGSVAPSALSMRLVAVCAFRAPLHVDALRLVCVGAVAARRCTVPVPQCHGVCALLRRVRLASIFMRDTPPLAGVTPHPPR